MPRLQSITQEHFEQRQMSPVTTKMVMGGAGGVPKMHPLKSSMPSIKAGSLIHGLRMAKMKIAKMPRV